MSAHNNGRSAVAPGQDEVGVDMMMAECLAEFWRSLRRLNVRNSKKNRNLLEVLDEDGKLRTDEEAVGVWAHILASW